MTPREKMSQAQVYVWTGSVDFIFRTSGATYPGVPHLVYKYLVVLVYYASPKSTKTGMTLLLFSSSLLTMMFSSFKSLCIMPLS